MSAALSAGAASHGRGMTGPTERAMPSLANKDRRSDWWPPTKLHSVGMFFNYRLVCTTSFQRRLADSDSMCTGFGSSLIDTGFDSDNHNSRLLCIPDRNSDLGVKAGFCLSSCCCPWQFGEYRLVMCQLLKVVRSLQFVSIFQQTLHSPQSYGHYLG